MKNKTTFLQVILGMLFALFYSYLYYLIIDFFAIHSLSISVNSRNYSYSLLFYIISIVILLLFHSYFLGVLQIPPTTGAVKKIVKNVYLCIK